MQLKRRDGGGRNRAWAALSVAIAATAVAALVWLAWFVWVPNHRPDLNEGERYGIDVSAHQDVIDWDKVAEDDISFAYIKATEGADHVDRQFTQNWKGSADAGLPHGAYHFFTLCRTGAEQAANFLSTVPVESDALPAVVDLELAGNCADRPDKEQVEHEVQVFLEEVESTTGKQVVLYIGDDWQAVYPMMDELERPLWLRRILRKPTRTDWWMWQFNYRSNIDGVDGGVDLNVMRGTEPEN